MSKTCATCPWRQGNKYNRWWLMAWTVLTRHGVIRRGVHRCHEKSNDLCGRPTRENVCTGSFDKLNLLDGGR